MKVFKSTLLLIFVLSVLINIQGFTQNNKTNYKLEKEILYQKEQVARQDEYINDRCRLDIYYPEEKGFATVIWFHGGG